MSAIEWRGLAGLETGRTRRFHSGTVPEPPNTTDYLGYWTESKSKLALTPRFIFDCHVVLPVQGNQPPILRHSVLLRW